MSLVLNLKTVIGISNKNEKIAKVTFRGVSHYARNPDGSDNHISFDKVFEWPIARAIESHETIELQILHGNKYFTKKTIGIYGLVLQQLIEDGFLKVCDSLLDINNMPIGATVTFDVTYHTPDGSIGEWSGGGFEYPSVDDDQQALIAMEQNITRLERTYSQREYPINGRTESRLSLQSANNKSPIRKRSSTLTTVKGLAHMIRLGKQRPPADDEEQMSLKDADLLEYGSVNPTNRLIIQSSAFDPYYGVEDELRHDEDDNSSLSSFHNFSNGSPLVARRSKVKYDGSGRESSNKAQDFQVCITIVEARQLAGLNMDPVVCVQVGNQKKHTSVKESTNCPYYNEYFVFDFHTTPSMIFDKIITLTVLHSRNLIRSGKVIGSFKLDVGTVFTQPDHQFYHKWAVLTDPDDIAGGPKGYLKCDISVVGKGDAIRPPPKCDKDEDDIEVNLLLPDGVPAERQRARFIMRIYRADGLPRMNSGFIAKAQKVLTGAGRDLVDPYVQVSFAGHSGKTSVKKNSYEPVWNEQIVFTEMFPPLCQRIKIQIKDHNSVNQGVIGTHYVDLSAISNEGEKGFLPTLGPCFIHLYGSTRDYSLFNDNDDLNDGLGEGVSYRGRILLSIRTDILDSFDTIPDEVTVENTKPVNEVTVARNEEFFLFACLMEASMLDKRIGERSTYLELSIGNAGNTMDGHNPSVTGQRSGSDSDDTESESASSSATEAPYIQSTTPPMKPVSNDKLYYNLPYGDDKPCLNVRSLCQDHRRRLYNSNLIQHVVDKLEEGVAEVQHLLNLQHPSTDRKLRSVLEDLCNDSSRYLSLVRAAGGVATAGKTKLDKERLKLCQREIGHINSLAKSLKSAVTKSNVKEKLRNTTSLLKKLKLLMEDPQHGLPDVFLWLISGGKRIAYQRIPARQIIYSIVEEESGNYCGKVQTLLLKLPGKKGTGPAGWAIQAKVQAYFWLGLTKHKKNFLKKLPKGYETTPEVQYADKIQTPPPAILTYKEKRSFQLRAHMYQARSLIGSDSSGLSDPFARVLFGENSLTTQVIDETLSPTWDETLVFNDVVVYGNKEHITEEPPSVVVEIFDQDKVGKSEFIGRALAKPHVKLSDDKYDKPSFPPQLEWFELYRGGEYAGELLATFELLQVSDVVEGEDLPPLPSPKQIKTMDKKVLVLPVPDGIRPTLSKYRIEVLFWGLRDLKRINLMTVDKPRVDIECSGMILESTEISNYSKNPNFANPVKYFDVLLPEQQLYCPPLTIRVMDIRSFGRHTLVGTHIINSLHQFIYTPKTKRDKETFARKQSYFDCGMNVGSYPMISSADDDDYVQARERPITIDRVRKGDKVDKTEINNKRRKKTSVTEIDDHEENTDWWTKYFASMEELTQNTTNQKMQGYQDEGVQNNIGLNNGEVGKIIEEDLLIMTDECKKKHHTLRGTATAVRLAAARLSPKTQRKKTQKQAMLKIYPCELENVPEFNGFTEWLHTFDLFRGKKTSDESEDEKRIVGKFKGSLKVYKIPLPSDIEDHTITGGDPQNGLFQGLPSNEPIHVLVRVFIIKAIDLHPADLNGKADPYIVISLGNKRVSDKENYISKQLNPVFGKCFEFEATFPQDSMLTAQIFDWDLIGSDDLIGETKIDLENRFYSRHRATCGISRRYDSQGYNMWSDSMKPSQILHKLSKDGKVDGPFFGHNRVRVGKKNYTVQDDDHSYKASEDELALAVLKNWHEVPKVGCHLVPEHIESRPLYNHEKPGIEQGKLEMWIDMFPMDMPLPGPPTDISPRKPKSYELRVIIWNTDDVVLEDDAFFTGEKMSDIYIKGWLKGQEDTQSTDIHYRSLTGEGNFNWRFIFPFDYLVAEEKIVISRKATVFSWDETECKIPARLDLQVWDADHFSADDFLGAVTLDLNRFPRGAKSSNKCTLDMLSPDGNVPMVSLFKQKRVKGWWPFFEKKGNDEEMVLTGKVEAEIHLLTKEEAEKNPAGLGRNEPDPLDKPNRPDSSFIWFLNPLKSIKYIVWHNYKWTILKALLFMALAALLVLFFYSMPGYTMKKMIGA
ncbi:FER1L6 (predicted) [Pycnogonum litorale]